MKWDLDDLYLGFDDPKFANDLAKLENLVDDYNKLQVLSKEFDAEKFIVKYIKLSEDITILVRTLSSFCSLNNATEIGRAHV